MGSIFPQSFLEQFGYSIGEKEEATHYSTFGGSEWSLKVARNQIFYWCELGKSWRKWPLTIQHCTPIGEQEPNYKCGPEVPKQIEVIERVQKDSPIYTNTKYKGD